MTPAFDQQAYTMFRKAGIEPTMNEVKLLADDLCGIADDELDGSDPTNCIPENEQASDAADMLLQRIGGLAKLRGYVDCLKVGV